VLDPCTGTGNFIVNLLGRIKNIDLPQKYFHDLFANEIMLLPYYVASGNIEHEYFERLGEYRAFEGLCFADTLDMLHSAQSAMFAEANTARVDDEKAADITVIIGNPPYNAGQKNENDNNKNRAYKGIKGTKGIDDLIHDTYAKASKATNLYQIYDPYVRFFKWASERLKGKDGVICFVSNNSFIKKNVFDGMRKTLAEEFNHIWHLDLGGDMRSENGGNVFDITVGVGVTILVRNSQSKERFIRYHRVLEDWNKKEKLDWIGKAKDLTQVEWQELKPNSKNAWLTEGLEEDFETFVPMGTKVAKARDGSPFNETLFNTYSLGLNSNRDDWVFDFHIQNLRSDIKRFIKFYNQEIERWQKNREPNSSFDTFVQNEDKSIKWSSTLKDNARRGRKAIYDDNYIVRSIYRPYCKQYLYYDSLLIHRPGAFKKYFPKGKENRVILVPGPGNRQPFGTFMTDLIPALDFAFEKAQCFPLYTYSTDGELRHDNITQYALTEAQQLYGESITREDIFYATYALLHHPAYRAKYAENLKLDLPRLPLFEKKLDFAQYARIGKLLGDLHVNYETAAPFALPLKDTTPNGKKFSARVEKMRFSKDKSTLVVNDSISLSGFTPQMFQYKLGNRSALDWVVECYRVKTDKRSGLVSDPNREDEPRFILDLIGKVATVSLETQRLIGELPEWISTKE
jgi:predicted helicase